MWERAASGGTPSIVIRRRHSQRGRVGPLCMHTQNACRTSVICNIISASTMTAMRESTPQGGEGGKGDSMSV